MTAWAVDPLKPVRRLRGHPRVVNGVASGPDRLLVTGGWDGTAKLWDVESGGEGQPLRGHDAPVSQVAVSPDGSRVATGGGDGTTRIWDAATGRRLLTLHSHGSLVYGVAFSPDGRLLATASPDGAVALHVMPLEEFVEVARDRVMRTLTVDECDQYLHRAPCPAVPS